MNAAQFAKSVLTMVLVLAPGAALACGELKFNAGRGLPFQSYLTPRPANVLILSSAPTSESEKVSAGLEKAGHRVTVVADVGAMQSALQSQHYDIVITSFDAAEAVASTVTSTAGAAARILPVVSRAARNSAAVRERFEQFVLDGASLGQYLISINKLLPSAR